MAAPSATAQSLPAFAQPRLPVVLTARMTGGQEAPGPGDPDGLGFATIIVLPDQRMVCYVLAVTNIAPATAAHIHRAPRGQPGPVVLPLDAPPSGASNGCVSDVDAALIEGLRTNPSAYYVNVHNMPYPDGAVRGQLIERVDTLDE